MTVEGNGQPRKYNIDFSGLVAREIKKLKKEARKRGQSEEVRTALAVITDRLKSDPSAFGELVKDSSS
jgi:hypothetical protein